MKLLFNEYTDTGKIRSVNEDYSGKWYNQRIDSYIFCVADGMGGYGFGDMASKIAVYSVLKDFALMQKKDISITKLISNIFNNAQERLKNYKIKHNINMFGTTLSLLLFINGSVIAANIGDTRIYSLFNDHLARLSYDHNFVQELLYAKEITEEQALNHPKKNMLTKALTGDGNIDVEPHIKKKAYAPGITYIIATDGLYRMLNDSEIQFFFQFNEPDKLIAPMMEKVYQRGAIDNITLQIIRTLELS